MKFNTEQMLILRYGFNPMIQLEEVAKDYLGDNTMTEIKRKARNGEIPFPVVINGKGKSTTYHVPLKALAVWIDAEAQNAIDDYQSMLV